MFYSTLKFIQTTRLPSVVPKLLTNHLSMASSGLKEPTSADSSFTTRRSLRVEERSLVLLLVFISFIWEKDVSHETLVGGRLSMRSMTKDTFLKSPSSALKRKLHEEVARLLPCLKIRRALMLKSVSNKLDHMKFICYADVMFTNIKRIKQTFYEESFSAVSTPSWHQQRESLGQLSTTYFQNGP